MYMLNSYSLWMTSRLHWVHASCGILNRTSDILILTQFYWIGIQRIKLEILLELFGISSQPNPTQPNPTQPNPTQPNPTQPNPTH